VDFALFGQNWFDSDCWYCNGADLNGNEQVDFGDLQMLAGNWLARVDYHLVSVWPFDTDGSDSVGSHDGTLINGAWISTTGPAVGVGALELDGIDDYVEITGYPGVTGDTSRTCMAWIKTTTGGDILGWGNNLGLGTKWRFRVVSTGHLAIQVQGSAQTTTATVNDGQWHHVAVVLPDVPTPVINDLQLYIDGSQITDITTSAGTEPINTGSDSTVKIGAQSYLGSPIDYFEGQIDEVRVYSEALSQEAIQALATE
jgi:hypothetical protein